MTFRARLTIGFAALALVLVVSAGFAVRLEMFRRLEAQYQARVDGFTHVIRRELGIAQRDVAERLEGLGASLAGDTRFRLGLVTAEGAAAAYVVDWAANAMRVAGLDALAVEEAGGGIVSSGHFRSAFGQPAAGLRGAMRDAAGPALVRLRTAEGGLLVLAALDSVTVAGRRLMLVGGERAGHDFLARLPGPDDATIVLESPGDTVALDVLPDPGVFAEIRVPHIDATAAAPRVASARFVVGHSLAPLVALRRSMDRWLLVAGMVAGLVGALAGGVLAGRLAQPVRVLAREVGATDVDRAGPFSAAQRGDEVGVLARALEEMTRRVRASADRLREAERRIAVGDVARQVNHDVKNGLVPIRNVVRHLAETAERDPDRLVEVFRERKGTIESALEHLDHLARTYARLAPSVAEGSTEVNAVVRAVTNEGGAVSLALAERLPAVRGDATAIRRVVENLLRNALEASGEARVETGTRDGTVQLVVRDTGPGMSREQLDRAFEGFYTTKPDGTGLGLTVVRRLVQDLGGNLRIETAPGSGTIVTVDLPPVRRSDSPPGGDVDGEGE